MTHQFLREMLLQLLSKMSHAFSKEGFLGSIAVAFFLWTAGIHNLLAYMAMFVITDLVTGTWASIKKGEGFRSRKFYVGGVFKLFVHSLMIMLMWKFGSLFDIILPVSGYAMASLMTGFILLYEFSSITENVLVIFPDMVFLKKMRNMLRHVLNKQTKNLEENLGGMPSDETNTPEDPKP